MLPTSNPLQNKRYTQPKNKGMEKDMSCNRHEEKSWNHTIKKQIILSDKIVLKTKAIVRHKEGHYVMMKRTIQQEDITLVNIYEPDIGVPK